MRPTVLLAIDDAELTQQIEAELQRDGKVAYCGYGSPEAAGAELAACWFPRADLLSAYPSLKAIQAVSAGVDHLGPALLNSSLPVSRIVDAGQKQGMLEYVLWGVLYYQRDFDRAIANQQQQHWHLYPQKAAADLRIGVLGLGEMGRYVAGSLAAMGYRVSGWARSAKEIAGVTTFTAESGLQKMLSTSDVLVNLLPLTPQTRGILNAAMFAAMPQGAVLINAGRGGHLLEADLIAALDSGQLRGAILDVFDEEPLRKGHPLWNSPGVLITPHMASSASPSAIAAQITENALRVAAGLPLLHQLGDGQPAHT
ncbi:glyoxylate/hydroxypyruvate reductase A [Granulosicoccaceae sp. 1_MG-2023]|nr:glyoxylate/hydroxypyruvate reductase A [Granulosicoccaceae sp. 1_MG-2023]